LGDLFDIGLVEGVLIFPSDPYAFEVSELLLEVCDTVFELSYVTFHVFDEFDVLLRKLCCPVLEEGANVSWPAEQLKVADHELNIHDILELVDDLHLRCDLLNFCLLYLDITAWSQSMLNIGIDFGDVVDACDFAPSKGSHLPEYGSDPYDVLAEVGC
jgi:hypothetical protein